MSVRHFIFYAGYPTMTWAFLKNFIFIRPHELRKSVFSTISTLGRIFEKFRFRWPYSLDTCGREGNPQRKVCVFRHKRVRVDGALKWTVDDSFRLADFLPCKWVHEAQIYKTSRQQIGYGIDHLTASFKNLPTHSSTSSLGFWQIEKSSSVRGEGTNFLGHPGGAAIAGSYPVRYNWVVLCESVIRALSHGSTAATAGKWEAW